MSEPEFQEGSTVFFNHPKHSWVLGTVSSFDGKAYSCKTSDPERKEVPQGEETKKLTAAALHTVQTDVLDENVSDLLDLTLLHDSTLLRCLYLRYMQDLVYTNIGAIVVALNPFNYKIPWYMDDKMGNYLAEGPTIQQNIPHSWAQAHNTYYEMMAESGNQSILISGESGAGKTEATKIVMKYLAHVSCLRATGAEQEAGMLVGTKLTSCSPILECFGNAKTVRNDNSSRFGKFMKVKFSSDGILTGAHTTKYLLEKSRIITAAMDERVYHAFYIVTRGRLRRPLGLDADTTYRSLTSGQCLNNGEFNTEEDFDEVCGAMSGIGMSDHDIQSVWRIPAGVLSLLNVNFTKTGDDACEIERDSDRYLDHVAKLWGVDEEELRNQLLTKTITVPGKTITSPNTITAAVDTRDALCKGAYDGVFAWLVDKCNELCDVATNGSWIGLLDIFGFEDFKVNSFEQVCINLTNETLQNHYNSYIFTKDMDECRAEGIDVTNVTCPDNGPCLKMISGKGGIIPLLDEECSLGKGSELSFLEKVMASHGNSPFFDKKKQSRDTFMIRHYAATVTYDVNGWLDKNRDTLKDPMKNLLRCSTDSIVAVVLPAPIPPEQKRGGGLTVGGFFNSQLNSLMEVINSTNPHWIRCVKPHPAKKPRMFDGVSTMAQLESSGVLGTVKIRKAGYPVRIVHDKFMRRYIVVTSAVPDQMEEALRVILVEAQLPTALAQIGKTKVFLKSEAYQKLERLRDIAVCEWAYKFQRLGRALQQRQEMFLLYVAKHREQLIREKKEREEKARLELEAAEAAKKAAAEKERLAREAEERRRREEELRMQRYREGAAIVLQKYVRGGLTRIRVFRRVVEEQRAAFEQRCEAAMCIDRAAALEVDALRLKSEKQWVGHLNEVDQLSRYMVLEKQRKSEKEEQKYRIQRRERERKEEVARKELVLDEIADRQAITVKCKMLAKHKQESEHTRARAAAAAARSDVHRRPLPSRDARVSAAAAATAATQVRSDKLLSQYATSRARAFEEYFPSAPPPPVATARLAEPQQSARHFERSKNRWERREEWLGSRDAMLGTNNVAPPPGSGLSAAAMVEETYTGPYRVAPAPHTPAQAPPQRDGYTAPRLASPAETSVVGTPRDAVPHWLRSAPAPQPTPASRRADAEHRDAVEWDSVFNSRFW